MVPKASFKLLTWVVIVANLKIRGFFYNKIIKYELNLIVIFC